MITVQGRHCHLKLFKTTGSFLGGLLKPNFRHLQKQINYCLSWSCPQGSGICKLSIGTMCDKKESCSKREHNWTINRESQIRKWEIGVRCGPLCSELEMGENKCCNNLMYNCLVQTWVHFVGQTPLSQGISDDPMLAPVRSIWIGLFI